MEPRRQMRRGSFCRVLFSNELDHNISVPRLIVEIGDHDLLPGTEHQPAFIERDTKRCFEQE